MDEKQYSRIIRNPRHIEGVFNYCDSLCKYCPLTFRCSVFAANQAMGSDLHQTHDKSDESLWPRLDSLQPFATNLLATHADHPGLPVPKEPKFKRIRMRPVDTSPLGTAAKRYMEFAHRFITDNEKTIPPLGAPDTAPVTPSEAFDIIASYCLFITVKLSRALSRDEFDEEMENDPMMADMPRDQDGSAKIALIALDRSILAWSALSQIESLTATALPAILTLDRLRHNVEKHFPKARPFQRPGFDTLRFK